MRVLDRCKIRASENHPLLPASKEHPKLQNHWFEQQFRKIAATLSRVFKYDPSLNSSPRRFVGSWPPLTRGAGRGPRRRSDDRRAGRRERRAHPVRDERYATREAIELEKRIFHHRRERRAYPGASSGRAGEELEEVRERHDALPHTPIITAQEPTVPARDRRPKASLPQTPIRPRPATSPCPVPVTPNPPIHLYSFLGPYFNSCRPAPVTPNPPSRAARACDRRRGRVGDRQLETAACRARDRRLSRLRGTPE